MSHPTRSAAFWIAYAIVAVLALVVAARLFPLAIPIVNLDIKLNRSDAVAQAEADAARLHLAPDGHRSAVRFNHDDETQNYVELEGGGKEAFAALTRNGPYAPYWWEVRLFAPGVIDEATLQYKPDGTRNGFSRRVAETYVRDPATKALDADEARKLAEQHARDDWGVDLRPYRLLEQSQQVRPTGRVDHSFVYERPEALGEARMRLRLDVAGDELVGVDPFVHVPESFERRYEELRSANNLIAGVASIAAGLLWGLGGCVLGVLWLARQRWLLWREAVVAGLIVGALLAASVLAQAPAGWFGVDTTQTATTFWLRQIALALAAFLAGGLGLALVYMAAESLSRRAFPHQPQLWQLWSREAGASVQVAGRTLGGYLFVPIELALIALFYYATNRYFGWWQPSELLTDPNVLGSAVPALTPIALSLQAGTLEECLFRAVPLSLGALIGARYGHRTLGIVIALVLQALVFGGAHANYPGFPAYSRPLELLVPSLVWGLIFLRFGLLPTMLLHGLFDLVLFAIPVFLVAAPGARLQQALIVLAGAVPLLVMLYRRMRAGRFVELPAQLLNAAWQALPTQARSVVAPVQAVRSGRVSIAFQRALPILGVAGFIAWVLLTPFRTDVHGLPLSRAQALVQADAAVRAQGGDPGPPFHRFASIRQANEDPTQWASHTFVWREGGRSAYRSMVGTWLAPPVWEVRYTMLEGDVDQRAEEWRVTVASGPEVRTVRHVLPESRPGAKLDRQAAEGIAARVLRTRFNADATKLRLVTADEAQRTARTDWTFHYADPSVAIGNGGEARYLVQIVGDSVGGAGRYVRVPEAWLRAESERSNRAQVTTVGAMVLLALAGLVAVVIGIVSFTHHHSDNRALRIVAALGLIVTLLASINAWPVVAMSLNTAQPLSTQVAMRVILSIAGAVLAGLFAGLTAGVGAYGARSAGRHPLAGWLPPWLTAVCASLFLLGVQAAATAFAPASAPLWPSLQWASQWSPLLGSALSGVAFVQVAAVSLFVLHVLARVTRDWSTRAWMVVLVIVVLQLAASLAGASGAVGRAVVGGIAGGLATAAVLWLLLRYDATLVPVFAVTSAIANGLVRAAQAESASAWIDFAVGAAIAVAMTILVTRYIARALPAQKPSPEQPETGPSIAS